ncbi:MAG: hypothetical protein VB050_03770 [Geobacteraceae bacterium]|nr:hypothetical protein [Geobacteraceae bacterium]
MKDLDMSMQAEVMFSTDPLWDLRASANATTALDRGLAENLAKARAVRAEKLKANKPAVKKAEMKKG